MPTKTDSQETASVDWAAIREKKGISLEDICERTHIHIRKLEAIERHDFAALGMPTFALGYLRSYAKIIEQDPEILVAAYHAAMGAQSGLFSQTGMSAVSVAPAGKLWQNKRWQKIGVLQLSIAVIAAWIIFIFLSSDDDAPEAALSSNREQPTQQSAPSLQEDAVLDNSRSEASVLEPSSPSSEMGEDGAETGTAAGESDENDVAEDVTHQMISQQVNAQRDQRDDALSAARQAGESAPAERAENAADDILVFTFIDDCWVSVEDAEGAVLIAELKRKGDNLRLFGEAPFEVMLGNARAATLTINGEPVSTEPSAGKNTIRLTVASPR